MKARRFLPLAVVSQLVLAFCGCADGRGPQMTEGGGVIGNEQLKRMLQGTVLAEKTLATLEIPGAGEQAWAIEVTPADALEAWKLMRGKVTETGRWPVLVAFWSGVGSDWPRSILKEDLFGRFPFEQESWAGGSSPRAIIERSQEIRDVDEILRARSNDYEEGEVGETIDYSLEETAQRVGKTPDRVEIERLIGAGSITSRIELDRWLYQWEIRNGAAGAAADEETAYLNWFEPDQGMALILLPTPNSWEALAYLHWYGAENHSSALSIAVLREWNKKYGAELVAHFGTMLQLITSKRPSSPDEAFHLAWQQETLAPCTTMLPGASLRQHARALAKLDKWFLHERP